METLRVTDFLRYLRNGTVIMGVNFHILQTAPLMLLVLSF